MSDQPTPAPDVDDPTQSDDQLPKKDRDQIKATAQALIDGSLRMDSDEFLALPARVRRRAWTRYQAHHEIPEKERERNAARAADDENDEAENEARRRERDRHGRDVDDDAR